MAELRINKLERVGKQHLEDAPLTIGRSMKNDMCLPHPSVSRHHCVIEVMNGVTKLRDLESRHGTTVNGKAVKEVNLKAGDVIGLGIFEITFDDEHAPGPDESQDIDLELSSDDSIDGDIPLTGSSLDVKAVPEESSALVAQLNELRKHSVTMQAQLAEQKTELDAVHKERDQAKSDLESNLTEHGQTTMQLKEDLEAVTANADEHKRRAEEQEHRADDLETRLNRQTGESLEQLKSFEAHRADHDDRLKQHELQESTLRKQHEKSLKELESKSVKLIEALSKIAALKSEIKALKTQTGELTGRSENVDQYLNFLRINSQQVMQVLQKLTTVKQNVQTIEGMYVQTNEWVENAESYEAESYDEMVAQRDSVGEQLQAAHSQLDATITELQRIAGEFIQYILSEPLQATMRQPAKRSFLSRITKH